MAPNCISFRPSKIWLYLVWGLFRFPLKVLFYTALGLSGHRDGAEWGWGCSPRDMANPRQEVCSGSEEMRQPWLGDPGKFGSGSPWKNVVMLWWAPSLVTTLRRDLGLLFGVHHVVFSDILAKQFKAWQTALHLCRARQQSSGWVCPARPSGPHFSGGCSCYGRTWVAFQKNTREEGTEKTKDNQSWKTRGGSECKVVSVT